MALCDLSKNTIHGRRDDSDHVRSVRCKRQIPMLLFEDEHRQRIDSLVKVTGSASQIDGSILQLSSDCATKYDELFLVISPEATNRTIPVPPNAPVKPKRLYSKIGLKPKKLRFMDKERNDEAAQHKYSHDKHAQYSIEMTKLESNGETKSSIRRSKGQSNQRNLSAMLRNVQLDDITTIAINTDTTTITTTAAAATATTTDNNNNNDNNNSSKENTRYGKDKYERRATDARSAVKERANVKSSAKDSGSSMRLSRQSYSLQDLKKCPSVLSQCNDNLTRQEKLLWLQARRDIGMMIQCCRKNCKKWRYCDDYHDPVDVPRIWYCEMNSDESVASCFFPEMSNSDEFEQDLIENKYNAGSVVWARVNGYPWWPAIVDDCPVALRYYELQELSMIPTKYHVTFFNEHLRHTWLKCDKIKPFARHEKNRLVRKTVFDRVDYKEQLERACAQAQRAIPLSICHRLQRFSYVSQLRKTQENTQDKSKIYPSMWNIEIPDQDDDGIIAGTPINHVTLKQFYGSVTRSVASSNVVF